MLRQTIDELREQIRSLGMVNPTAVQEYEEVKERHHFLTMQLEDLNAAKDQLHKVIAEMDEVCRSKFEETFAQVRTEFRKLFTELFQGGRADLCLTEPDSPLTTGIEVVAQPPWQETPESAAPFWRRACPHSHRPAVCHPPSETYTLLRT